MWWWRSVLCLLLASAGTIQAEDSHPFVAGFERFGRYDDLSTGLNGKLLLTELSCTACHQTEVAELKPKRGPRLNGAGNRLQKAWMREFLLDPQKTKPGTTMPQMLHGFTPEKQSETVDALVAFLGEQREAFPVLKASGINPIPFEFWKLGDAVNGRQLFHQIGCVACHEPDRRYESAPKKASPVDQLLEQLSPEELKELGLESAARAVPSVPLPDFTSKYTSRSLTFFLLDPEKQRTAGRMPNFQLQPTDAADLAAWLLKGKQNGITETKFPAGSLVERGKHLFGELGCANCHTVNGLKPSTAFPSLAKLNAENVKSCFQNASAKQPSFPLDDAQTKSIRHVLKDMHQNETKKTSTTDEFTLLKLNCYACHERGKLGGVGRHRRNFFETVGHVDIGDEGRLPPPLTGVGRKLKPAWIQQVLAGKGKLRPHFTIRMPQFPKSQVAGLSAQFIRVDEAKTVSPNAVFKVGTELSPLATAGRKLIDTGCVQCHSVRGDHLAGIVGVDLKGVTERIQPDWLREFLLNPGALKKGTRMPTFFPKGKSSNPQILNGDVERQLSAIYAYLKEIERQPLPEKIQQGKVHNFELIPKDRPILLRTFMEDAGPQAIAVGFPDKVHLAFDAEQVRVVQAWRGKFLDAHGTWFNRFAPPAKPLGTHLIEFPSGLPFAVLENSQTPWPKTTGEEADYQFRGYRLDAAGVPAFLYRFANIDIEDRLEPTKTGGLNRTITLISLAPKETTTIWFRLHQGTILKKIRPLSRESETGLVVHLGEGTKKMPTIDLDSQWLQQLTFQNKLTINVSYEWK